jgi:glycosyltransferase involved in cell wall biosynthesis
MKVLFLNFWASRPGGAEFSLVDIIREMSINHQTRLITSESGFLTEKAMSFGCICSILKCPSGLSHFNRHSLFFNCIFHIDTLFKFFLYCNSIRKNIRSDHPDIIHANVPKSHIILFFLIFTGFRGKSVFHIREIFKRNSTVYMLYSLLFRFVNASGIAISQAVLDSLPRIMKRKMHVIYNGIYLPENISLKGSLSQPPKFLYLGRVVPWKGCELLIDGYNLIVKKYPDISGHLSIVGGTFYWDISYRAFLQNKIQALCLSRKISLHDHMNNTEPLFSKHSVLCVPSDSEPFGRVAAEAMAFGLPVIGFHSGGLSEVVSHNQTGLLAHDRTANSISTLMEYFILHPEEINRMGLMARERCKLLFDATRQIPAIINFIIS